MINDMIEAESYWCEKPVWERDKSVIKPEKWLSEIETDKEYLMMLTGGWNAKRLSNDCIGWLLYDLNRTEDYKLSNWYVWDNTYWKRGDLALIQKAAKKIIGFMQDELWYFIATPDGKLVQPECRLIKKLEVKSTKEINAFVNSVSRHIKSTDSRNGLCDMLNLSISIEGMSGDVMGEADHNLIGLKNGIFNTLTGKWTPIEYARSLACKLPIHYIDRKYTPGAVSDKYIKFLETICTDNESADAADKKLVLQRRDETVKYLNRLGGYNLVAGNPEQKHFFHVGGGSNGKSTLINVWKIVLGSDEAQACSIKEFNSSSTERPSPTLAQVAPKRLATFSEAAGSNDKAGEKIPISAEKFKSSTDQSTVERGLYEKGGETVRLWKGHFTTNDMPEFDHFDGGVARRLVIIPYNHRFVEQKDIDESEGEYTQDDLAIRDYEFELTEGEEGDKILSMTIDECILYREEGMVKLPDYCAEIAKNVLVPDRFLKFIEESYVRCDSGETGILWSDIRSDYNTWIDAVDNYDKYGSEIQCRVEGVKGDNYNSRQRVATMTETKKLMKALQVMGYKPKSAKGRDQRFPLKRKKKD